MHLSKLFSWILRMIVIFCTLITMGLTLTAPITMKVSTPGLVKSVVNKAVKESDNQDVQNGLQLFQALGVEDVILSSLPKQLKIETSYYNFYKFSNEYQKEGKLTAKQVGLSNKTDQEKIINDLVLKFANNKLDEEKETINQGISYFKILFFAIVILYFLAIALIIFNKRIAFIPLLLGSVGAYAVSGFGASQLQSELQSTIYSGFKISLGSGFSLSVILAIILSIIWFAIAGLGKTHMLKKKPVEYQGKHVQK